MPPATSNDVPVAAPVYAGMAVGEADAKTKKAAEDKEKRKNTQPSKTPLVSVSTDVLDMSWTGAMDLAEPSLLRPTGIVLPFLDAYPIDNLEVKFRLLNLHF